MFACCGGVSSIAGGIMASAAILSCSSCILLNILNIWFLKTSLIIISLYYHGHIGAGWSCCGLATGTDVTYAINVIIRIKVAKITFIFNVSNDTESISSQQLIKHEEKFAYVRSSIKLTLFLSYNYHLQMLILFVQADTKKNIGDARVVIDYRMTFD